MNLFSDLPAKSPNELVQTLLTTPHLRIERIVSQGHASPADFWYDQQENEWVLLLSGAARLQVENNFIALAPGDYLHIAAHERHRVEWTTPDEPTIWLAILYPA